MNIMTEQLTISAKLEDLSVWAQRAFSEGIPDIRLCNARKASEALCKVLVLKRFGNERGSSIANGLERIDGSKVEKPTPLMLAQLVQCVSSTDVTPPVIETRETRLRIQNSLEQIRLHTNPSAHDRATMAGTSPSNDVMLVLANLASLLHWLYESVLDRSVPENLGLSITKHAGIATTTVTDYEDVRGEDIVRLYYPKQQIIAVKETVPKERISYEFVTVEAARNNTIGFLFVKKHITLGKTLKHFADNLQRPLNNLTICSPRVHNRESGQAVDRLAGLREAYDGLANSALPKSPDFFYTDDFVWTYCLAQQAEVLSSPIETEGCFVDQKLHVFQNGDSKPLDKDSIDYMRGLIESPEVDRPVHLVVGAAGVGKTTFCKQLVHVINSEYEKKRALFISATDLRDVETDSSVTTVADLYRLYARANGVDGGDILEGHNLEINISCGNIVLIIDGLDEIESILKDKFSLDDFLRSADLINGSYHHCSVIITIRDFYIDRYKTIRSVAIYSLRGFSDDSIEAYLKKRFCHVRCIQEAKALLTSIHFHDDRYLMPLYLSLICDIVESEVEGVAGGDIRLLAIAETSYYQQGQTVDRLVHDLIRREIAKQSLAITCDEYFELLREIAIEHSGVVQQDDLNAYVDVYLNAISPTSQDAKGRYRQIYVSPLLVHDTGTQTFRIKYNAVETWVKARFVVHCFAKHEGGAPLRKLLAEMYYGRSELLDELVKLKARGITDFLPYGRILLKDLIAECRRPASNDGRMTLRRAISGLVYLVLLEPQDAGRTKYTVQLKALYGASQFEYLSAFGEFCPIDFTGCTVQHGWFERFSSFGKCLFPTEGTVFIDTTFENVDPGQFKVTNPQLFDDPTTLDERLRRVIDRGQAVVTNNTEELQRDLQRILKVGFRAGGFLWKSMDIYKSVTLRCGMPLEKFMDLLVRQGVLERSAAIQGRRNYGYVVTVPFRQAAKNLIENSLLGPELQKVARVALKEIYGN